MECKIYSLFVMYIHVISSGENMNFIDFSVLTCTYSYRVVIFSGHSYCLQVTVDHLTTTAVVTNYSCRSHVDKNVYKYLSSRLDESWIEHLTNGVFFGLWIS